MRAYTRILGVMRAGGHALVLLTVVALVMPATPAVGGETTDAALESGHQLVRRGDFGQAEQFYSATAAVSPNLAPRALLLEARTALADGDPDAAENLLQQLLATYPGSDQQAGAYFSLEQVRRTAKNCEGALRALDAFEAVAGRNAIGPYAALQRAQCAAALEDWPGELAAAKTALGTEGGGPRLTQIEGLERAAEADLKLGRKQEALDFYNRSLALAGTRAYRAEMLFSTATVARALGQASLAADRYRGVVIDYADQARAPGALDALIDMNRGDTVSLLQASTVRFNARDYRTAISQLDQVDASSPDWAAAQLQRAEAFIKLGDEDSARTGLEGLAQTDGPGAGAALLRLGQLEERDGDEPSAEAHYRQMAQVAPERVAEALFHVGFTRFVRGDKRGALAAWRAGMASGPPAPVLQSQLLYWSAKALPAGSPEATESFNLAAAAAPESFYGLRAQEQMNGVFTIASAALGGGISWWLLSSNDLQERDTWFNALGTNPDRVATEVEALPAMRRAETLLELGLGTEASWEIEGVVQQYAQVKDVAHMSAVGEWAMAHDQPQLTLRIGKQMSDLVGLNALPRALQKQVYPAAWGDLVAEQAAGFGVDPLLVLAIVRQESSFDPRAQSGAQASGLTQIVPATARTIAARLGRDDFGLRDLFKPGVSLEFGSWYVGQLLGDYKGRVFPALAAYDAGGGNVTRWLQRFGDDPDVLVEQIPFNETQTYLRLVYENYWHYQALYGGR